MSLHPALQADTKPVCLTKHAQILLMDDSRWPWLILVPTQPNIEELHDLSDLQRNGFMGDVNNVSEILQAKTSCKSVNVAMLGNVVSQLHCHVVARNEDDPAWPKPVWGFEARIPYKNSTPDSLLEAIKDAFY